MEKCKPFPINEILHHIKCNKCIERKGCWDGWHYPYGYAIFYDKDGCAKEPEDDLCCYFTPYLYKEKCEGEEWCADDRECCIYYQNFKKNPDMCVEDAPYWWCYDRLAEIEYMEEHREELIKKYEEEERKREEERRKFPFLYEKIDENRKRLEEFNKSCLEELIEREKRSIKSGGGLNGIKG